MRRDRTTSFLASTWEETLPKSGHQLKWAYSAGTHRFGGFNRSLMETADSNRRSIHESQCKYMTNDAVTNSSENRV